MPNRKIRNQPLNRNHDIEFAAEISTSLIAQVRNLQALLAERDEEVKDLQHDRSRLEVETENLQQRLKVIDESEHRYKEENWNLETRLQEVAAQQKEAADREKKLTQALNVSKAEKNATQKELDEVKLSHAKLAEEHAASVKHHDIELGTAKRNIVMAEGERSAMQRKIDDLMSQNTELAKAVSAQRGRTMERDPATGTSDEDFETATDNATPEHSPPPSPIKGTPRHSMLETETMKTSLLHAQRTIQSQRSLIHREKTEKLELRRIIQDLRDDLEKARTDVGGTTNSRRSRKVESREFKKPPRLLGSFRSSRQEILLDDPDWEDHQDLSPRASSTNMSPAIRQSIEMSHATDSSDHFDTANEAGESAFETGFETAFETANERGTETEDFQTTHEDLSGSDGAATETDTPSRGFGRMKRPPSLMPSTHYRNHSRESLHSTASTSADENDASELRTPVGTISSQRSRFRLSRGPFTRNARQQSEEPNLRSSPASFASSVGGTPQAGQSLFAELQDMGSDNDSVVAGNATPSRRSARSVTPGSTRRPLSPPPAVPALPKVIMVDSGVMTDPVEITVGSGNRISVIGPLSEGDVARPKTMESVVDPAANRTSMSWLSIREDDADNSRPISTFSYSDASAQHDVDMDAKLAQFPIPPTSTPRSVPPTLSISALQSEDIEPQEEAHSPVSFSFTHLLTEAVEPEPLPEIIPPTLALSSIFAEGLEPVAEPEIPPPNLTMTSLLLEAVEPVAELPPSLSMTALISEAVEPVAELPPTLSMTTLVAEAVEPVAELPPALSMTNIITETVTPIAEPIVLPPALTLSNIHGETVEPVIEPEVPPPALSLGAIQSEMVEPIAEPEVPLPTLNLTSIQTEMVEPIAEPDVPPPALSLSTVQVEAVEPIAEPEVPLPVPPTLSMSSLIAEHIEPVAEPEPETETRAAAMPLPVPVPIPESAPVAPELSMSSIISEHLEPINEPEVIIPQPPLALASIQAEHIEPVEEPEVKPVLPTLAYTNIITEHVEPVAEPEVEPILPTLAYTNIITEHVEPVAEPEPLPPSLSVSSIVSEVVVPIPEPIVLPPTLALSTIAAEHVQPVSEPEPVAPELAISSIAAEQIDPIPELPPTLGFTTISTEHVEPISEPVPEQPILGFTSISTEHVEPISEPEPKAPSLAISTIVAEGIDPIAEPSPVLAPLALSAITAESVEPVSPEPEPKPQQNFGFSTIESVETLPISPRSPWREAFILPRDAGVSSADHDVLNNSVRAAALTSGRGRQRDSVPFIAEDETSQSFRDLSETETPESQQPFREVSANTDARAQRKQAAPMTDQGAQTSLTADEIDQLVLSRRMTRPSHEKTMSVSSAGTTGTTIHRPHESLGSPTRSVRKAGDDTVFDASPSKRPSSASSQKTSILDAPPLPPNHREIIEAARSSSSHGTQGAMGPPLWPASAMKNRPHTPSQRPMSPASVTPRVVRAGSGQGNAEVQSISKLTARSRQSSVSSFASELDNRFNMRAGGMPFDANGFGPNTDPRMIQAITQTMIGEFLWKYTRKTGRGEMSEKRHRRYFWVHPYTRTLYWSDQDPSTAGRSELRAKSVPIEAVRVVTDDNPMPPGLHRKSLVVIAPGRTVKFTCTTGQRHETWFNALSYLLLRTNNEGQADTEELAENITREDVDEFNPQYGRRAANGTRPQAPPSLSSYNSRTTRNESPAETYMYNIPTLVPSGQNAPSMQRTSSGTLSKISGYWKAGNFGSLRGRNASGRQASIYEASEVHDSAEDLREMIERQDRESDRLENVRACCDGKHDVGTLHHLLKKGRNSHAHPGPSTTPTPMASMRSRS